MGNQETAGNEPQESLDRKAWFVNPDPTESERETVKDLGVWTLDLEPDEEWPEMPVGFFADFFSKDGGRRS
jgi:hypothetical protein